METVEGARLTLLGPDAWVADRELVYSRRNRLPLRMVVLRDSAGSLNLYSPVALDEGTIEALAGLGEVHRIIVPNRFHTLFVGRAMDVYPQAQLLLPAADAGLTERFPRRAEILAAAQDLDTLTEIVPVRLRPGLDELVLYHDAAELLVLGDLLFNLHSVQSRLRRLLLHKDTSSLNQFYRWAMNKPFSQISMAHGPLVSVQARETFYQLFHHYSAA